MNPWSACGMNSVPTSGTMKKLATNVHSAIASTLMRCASAHRSAAPYTRCIHSMKRSTSCITRPSHGTREKRDPRRVVPDRRQHRIEREADEQAHQHRDRDGDAELEEETADDAAHERDRHEHGDDRERGRHHREADLVGAVARGVGVALAQRQVAHDVLAHDDGVVDQQADAQRQRHQRQEVEREAEGVQRDEGGDHRDRQREAGDDRAAPAVQEQEHDQHGEQAALDDRVLDAVDAALDLVGASN